MNANVTTHPGQKDQHGNYPVKVDGIVVGWGSVRRARHSHHTRFHFYPLGGALKATPYDVNRDGWLFEGVADLKLRLPSVLADNAVA